MPIQSSNFKGISQTDFELPKMREAALARPVAYLRTPPRPDPSGRTAIGTTPESLEHGPRHGMARGSERIPLSAFPAVGLLDWTSHQRQTRTSRAGPQDTLAPFETFEAIFRNPRAIAISSQRAESWVEMLRHQHPDTATRLGVGRRYWQAKKVA